MKKIFLLLYVLVFAAAAAFAQMPPESKPDQELTKDEATLRIQDYQQKVNALEAKLSELGNRHSDLSTQLKNQIQAYKDCREQLLSLLGAVQADVDAFRQRLGVIEGKVRQLKGHSDEQLADKTAEIKALEDELNQLRTNKLSLIPEFYNKIIYLAKEIKGLYREKKITTYTVGTWSEDRDCLWNISGKMEIYGDPFQWSKIWQANTSIIRNPDIIFPGQVLQVPPKGDKSSDEMKAERRYWRNKRAAAEAAVEEAKPAN